MMTETTQTPLKPRPNHRTRVFALIAFMVLCLIVSAFGGAVTATSVNDWYATLAKAVFQSAQLAVCPRLDRDLFHDRL